MSKSWNAGDEITAAGLNDQGLKVVAQSTPGMTLAVKAGVAIVDGTIVKYAGGNTGTITAPVTNPRIDLITIDSSGTIGVTGGVEGASPSAPAYPSDKTVLAEVYLRVGTTAIHNTDQGSHGYVYRDSRPLGAGITLISSTTGVSDAGKGIKTDASGLLDETFLRAKVRTLVYIGHLFGDSTTQFDITKSGNTVRYTYDGTGVNPRISPLWVPKRTVLTINGANFNAANNGTFVVTDVGTDWFEVYNPSGVAETNKTLGAGSIASPTTYTPSSYVSNLLAQCWGAGAGGNSGRKNNTAPGGSGGGGGGYDERMYTKSELAMAATWPLQAGLPGLGGAAPSAAGGGQNAGNAGNNSFFGNSTLPLTQGAGGVAGGSPSGGNNSSTGLAQWAGGAGGGVNSGAASSTRRGGGGGGGGAQGANPPFVSGASGGGYGWDGRSGGSAGGGQANGGDGQNFGEGGGGGGGSNNSGVPGSGGNGGPAAGGGGGGSTFNGSANAGRGGDGGDGRVVLTEFYEYLPT